MWFQAMRLTVCAFVLAAIHAASWGAERPPAMTAVLSPEVHADKRVTFRLLAPKASEVQVQFENSDPVAMRRDAKGVWSLTTDPMRPNLYGYLFLVDRVPTVDPSNPALKPDLLMREGLHTQSLLHVSGDSLPWELGDVPHGVIHHHFYRSRVLADESEFFVYTPPGYEEDKTTSYPVLYLLHGSSQDPSSWTAIGRAHVILDNLIAARKASPMLVVMPLGYAGRDRGTFLARFKEEMSKEIVPRVEGAYRVKRDRDSRAIAGLSMGATESVFTALTGARDFGWVGVFSPGGLQDDFDAQFPGVESWSKQELRLLWISCGSDDHEAPMARKLESWLTGKGIRHTDVALAGGHTWMVWRRNLADLAPLLFR
jgi:enterochelin esterase family protein